MFGLVHLGLHSLSSYKQICSPVYLTRKMFPVSFAGLAQSVTRDRIKDDSLKPSQGVDTEPTSPLQSSQILLI